MISNICKSVFNWLFAVLVCTFPSAGVTHSFLGELPSAAELSWLTLAEQAAVRNLTRDELKLVASSEGARLEYLVRLAERDRSHRQRIKGEALRPPGAAAAPLTKALDELLFDSSLARGSARWAEWFVEKHGQYAVTASAIVEGGNAAPEVEEAWRKSGRKAMYVDFIGAYYRLRAQEPRGLEAKVKYLVGKYRWPRAEFVLYVRFNDLGRPACDYLVRLLKDETARKSDRAGIIAEATADFLSRAGDNRAAEVPLQWLPQKSALRPLLRRLHDWPPGGRLAPEAHRGWVFLEWTNYPHPRLRDGIWKSGN